MSEARKFIGPIDWAKAKDLGHGEVMRAIVQDDKIDFEIKSGGYNYSATLLKNGEDTFSGTWLCHENGKITDRDQVSGKLYTSGNGCFFSVSGFRKERDIIGGWN